MSDLEFNFDHYKYGADAVSRKFAKQMYKNERLEIKAVMNGYVVERSWREPTATDPKEFDYRHVQEEFLFKDWTEVILFVEMHKLDVPPAKI